MCSSVLHGHGGRTIGSSWRHQSARLRRAVIPLGLFSYFGGHTDVIVGACFAPDESRFAGGGTVCAAAGRASRVGQSVVDDGLLPHRGRDADSIAGERFAPDMTRDTRVRGPFGMADRCTGKHRTEHDVKPHSREALEANSRALKRQRGRMISSHAHERGRAVPNEKAAVRRRLVRMGDFMG